MVNPYQGKAGRQQLEELLGKQQLVGGNAMLARRIAAVARTEEIPAKRQLYLQDEFGKNLLFLVLVGSVALSNAKGRIATLKAGEFFGEFPMLDPRLKYTVNAVAVEVTRIATITERDLRTLCAEFPVVWENMARELAGRLRSSNSADGLFLDTERVRLGDILSLLKALPIAQFWSLVVAVATVFGLVASGAYWFGSLSIGSKEARGAVPHSTPPAPGASAGKP